MVSVENEQVIIDVDHLTKNYGHNRGVFDVSIKVHKGECYGYLGPNGAGKSTTIRHIMGFCKPEKGSVKIFGVDCFGNNDEMLKKVGFLPSESNLPACANGWELIYMMQDLRGERNQERLKYLLQFFKVDPNQEIKGMSVGCRRQLAVVVAFMNDPEVLILDEPTSGLDPVMQEKFIQFILEEKKRGKTILLSSHVFSEVDAVCDTISIIKDGVHVSTFNSSDFKNGEKQICAVCFFSEESFNKYLNKKKSVKVLSQDLNNLKMTVEFARNNSKEFFESLSGVAVKEIEEVPFSLQDYFMSFYKEEKNFDGLNGVISQVAVTEGE